MYNLLVNLPSGGELSQADLAARASLSRGGGGGGACASSGLTRRGRCSPRCVSSIFACALRPRYTSSHSPTSLLAGRTKARAGSESGSARKLSRSSRGRRKPRAIRARRRVVGVVVSNWRSPERLMKKAEEGYYREG